MKSKMILSFLVLIVLSLLSACVSSNPNQSITPTKEITPTKYITATNVPTKTTEPTATATPSATEIPKPLLSFTFREGTCFYEGPTSINTRDVKLKIIIEEGNPDAMDGVAIVTASLREEKSIEDLQAWPSTDQPPWLDVISLSELFPGPMEKEFSVRLPEEPAYFVCFHPTAKIGAIGPVTVQIAEETPPMLTVTFKDDTCFYEGPANVNTREVKMKFIIEEGNQDAMNGVAVVAVTLLDDKTIDDLKDWPSTDPPPWVSIIAMNELFPGPMEKEFSLRLPVGAANFACFYPEEKIGAFGPIDVREITAVQNTPVPTKVRVAPTNAPNPIPIVIDTDMAVDDWMAILYLLNRTDVEIKGITVTGAGEAHCDPGVSNALKLIGLAGRKNIPVACGRETPLAGDHSFPEEWRDFVNDFAGQELDPVTNPNLDKDAVGLLTSILETSNQKVTILTLGPLTNIAELLRVEPQVKVSINGIYVMGGAVEVPGNIQFYITGNEAAEWNIYIDPLAASEVFSSGVPVTLVPLDATNLVPLDLEFYTRLENDHPEPEASFVFDVLTKGEMGMIQSNSYYFWDPLAAAIMVNNTLAEIEANNICVDTDEGQTIGATQTVTDCPKIWTVVDVDADLFRTDFIETLNSP